MMEQGYTSMSGSRVSDNVFINTNGQLAAYTNQDTSSYLTPTSPITPQPPQILPSRPPFNSQTKQPNGEPFMRVDSGIETDSQNSPTPSTSTANPRNSAAVYEYINPKDVYLEPSANLGNRLRPGESASSGTVPTRAATSAEYVTSDSEDPGTSEEGLRRRFNPMYEALEKSATRLYAQTCHCKMQSTTQKQLRYLWCALIVIIIITIFLLGVIAYMLFFLIPSIQNHTIDHGDRLKHLESHFEATYSAEGEVSGQESTVNVSTVQPQLGTVYGMMSQLNSSVSSLSSQLLAVNISLQEQLQNISLTPGPQGPAGVGDLNSCFYMNRSSSQALPGIYSTTSWQPSLDILEDNIVMSAACGVLGGDQQFVETSVITTNKVQFRCRCDGNMEGYSYRQCIMHLIICPRVS